MCLILSLHALCVFCHHFLESPPERDYCAKGYVFLKDFEDVAKPMSRNDVISLRFWQ